MKKGRRQQVTLLPPHFRTISDIPAPTDLSQHKRNVAGNTARNALRTVGLAVISSEGKSLQRKNMVEKTVTTLMQSHPFGVKVKPIKIRHNRKT
jgi:hypothetical protein